MYATPECRRKADNQRDRDRREAIRATWDEYADRAVRGGWLEPAQIPGDLPGDYWTQLALAVEVVTLHGPAVEDPEDPRLTEFTAGVCEIIRAGTAAPEGRIVHQDDAARATAVHISQPQDSNGETAADQLSRLYEMRDPYRQHGHGSAGYPAYGDNGAIDLTGEPVHGTYNPLGPHPRTTFARHREPDPYATAMAAYIADAT